MSPQITITNADLDQLKHALGDLHTLKIIYERTLAEKDQQLAELAAALARAVPDAPEAADAPVALRGTRKLGGGA